MRFSRGAKIALTVAMIIGVGVVPLVYGTTAAYLYFFPPTSNSYMGFKGFAVGWTNWNQVKSVSVDVLIHVPTKDVSLNFQFFCGKSTSNQFVFILPFPIRSVQEPRVYMNLSAVAISVDSKNLSTSSQVQVSTKQPYANETLQVVIGMTAVGDLVSGAKGSYILTFPAGVYPPYSVESKANYINTNRNHTGFVMMMSPESYTFFVNIGLSNASALSSVYPSNYRPNPTNFTFPGSVGPTEWLNWNFTGSNAVPITIQFQDRTQRSPYEGYAYWGSAGIAIGISTLTAVALQYLDIRRKS